MSDFETLTLKQNRDLGDKIGSAERAKRFMSGELILVERSEAAKRGVILQFECKVAVAARRFVVAESFTRSNAKVKFGYIDERVEKLFGKIRENVPAGEIAVNTLLQDNHDPEIMVALGPQDRRFINLGQFYQAIEVQGHGQAGPLLVNGRSNIAYILDDRGAPWAVYACWYCGGWSVGVRSVASQCGWDAGYQVLSQVA